MNRLPEDFFGDNKEEKFLPDPVFKLEEGLKARQMFVPETWEAKLSKLKDEAFKEFLADNYPDVVFTAAELKRMAHIELPENSANEELLIFQGRPVLHFKWDNKKKTLEITVL